MYNFEIHLTGAIFDILPNATTSPRGSEKSNVRINISAEIHIPPPSSLISVPISICYILQFFQASKKEPIPSGVGPFILLTVLSYTKSSRNSVICIFFCNLIHCSVFCHFIQCLLDFIFQLCISFFESNRILFR